MNTRTRKEEKIEQVNVLLKKMGKTALRLKWLIQAMFLPALYILVGLTYNILPSQTVWLYCFGIEVVISPFVIWLAKRKDKLFAELDSVMNEDWDEEEKQEDEQDVFDF